MTASRCTAFPTSLAAAAAGRPAFAAAFIRAALLGVGDGQGGGLQASYPANVLYTSSGSLSVMSCAAC